MALSGPVRGSTTIQPISSGDGGGGGYGYGGGGGGGYTVKSNAPASDEINAQLENAGDIYKREVESANKGAEDSLNNILKQREANDTQLLMKRAQLARNSEWQPTQQKEQSTFANLRKTMGNAAYGSGMVDLQEGMGRYDDMSDVQLINTYKDNADNAYNSWYQANADLINDYNEQVIRANNTLDQAYNTYLSNIAGIDPQLARQAYEQQGREISRTEDDQTYKTNVLEKDKSLEHLLKMIDNNASTDNPAIPNSGRNVFDYGRRGNYTTRSLNNLIDYIRPGNAVGEVNRINNRGTVNTARGAFRPTYLQFPGYNYQGQNFAGYNIAR